MKKLITKVIATVLGVALITESAFLSPTVYAVGDESAIFASLEDEDSGKEISEEFTDETTEEITEEVTDATSDEASTEFTDEAIEEATEDATDDAAEDASEESTEESTEESSEEASDAASDESSEEALDAASEEISDDVETEEDYELFGETVIFVNDKCGKNIKWDITSKGVLTLTGSGEMYEYTTDTDVPWHPYRTKIKKLIFDGKITNIAKYAFDGCTALTTIENLESVEAIDEFAFNNCKALTSVSFGQSLKKLDHMSFAGCTKLKTYTFTGDFPSVIYTGTFKGSAKNPTVYYPRNRVSWLDVTAGKLGMSDLNPTLAPSGDPKYFTVTYKDAKGKSGKVITTQQVELGSKVTAPETPTKDAYRFLYWMDEATGSQFLFNQTKVVSDLTLYAEWKYEGYHVIFNYLQDGVEKKSSWLYDLGDKITDPTEKLVPKGYVCKGWSLSRDEKGNLGELVNVTKYKVTGDKLTFYSVFNKLYTVTAHTNSYGRNFTLEIENGTAIGLIETDVTLPRQKLEGWYYEKDFKTPVKDTDIVTKDTDIYAKWIEDETADKTDPRTNLDEIWVRLGADPQYQNGKAVMPAYVYVYDGSKILTRDKDYTLKALNATKVGKATLQITFKGNYSGVIKKSYNVLPYDLESYNISVDPMLVPYDRKAHKVNPVITWKVNGKSVRLKAGTDYKLYYQSLGNKEHPFVDPGEYLVAIQGIGRFTGTLLCVQTIVSQGVNLKDVKITGFSKSKPYTGNEVLQDEMKLTYKGYELVENTDFISYYIGNTEAGKASYVIMGMETAKDYGYKYYDKGSEEGYKFIGTKTLTFDIAGTPISKAVVENLASNVTYTGSPITMSDLRLIWKDPGSEVPKELKGIDASEYLSTGSEERATYDYTFEYKDNTNKGKAKLIITGVNRYSGTMTKTFNIKPLRIDEDYEVNESESTKTIDVQTYGNTRYKKGGVKPKVRMTHNRKDGGYSGLMEKLDFTVSYSSNTKVGSKGVITITGKGNYCGTIKLTFTVYEGTSSDFAVSAQDVAWQNKAGIYNPKVTVSDGSSKLLVKNTDYTCRYVYAEDSEVKQYNKKTKTYDAVQRAQGDEVDNKKDIVPLGTKINVVVTPKGSYEGNDKTCTFRVCEVNIASAQLANIQNVYNPKDTKVYFNLYYQGQRLIPGTDYEAVSIEGNTGVSGTSKVTVRGLGKFGGTRVVTIKKAKRTPNVYGK